MYPQRHKLAKEIVFCEKTKRADFLKFFENFASPKKIYSFPSTRSENLCWRNKLLIETFICFCGNGICCSSFFIRKRRWFWNGMNGGRWSPCVTISLELYATNTVAIPILKCIQEISLKNFQNHDGPNSKRCFCFEN